MYFQGEYMDTQDKIKKVPMVNNLSLVLTMSSFKRHFLSEFAIYAC
jgi:hypothetical protein